MSAPFSVKKSVQANAVKPSAPNPLLSSSKPRAPTQQDSTDNIVEVEVKKIGKGSLPLTLDMMKVISNSHIRIVRYSIAINWNLEIILIQNTLQSGRMLHVGALRPSGGLGVPFQIFALCLIFS